MKRIYQLLLPFALVMAFQTENVHAQAFFNYQTIGVHTVFFSVTWRGKPEVGFGYIRRDFGRTFTDVSAELRFPVNQGWDFGNFEAITGISRPVSIDKAFMGSGAHLKLRRHTSGEVKTTTVKLALALIPSYAYARSINNKPYSTIGVRLGYAPVIYAKVSGGSNPGEQFLAAHTVEVGGHLDLHLERTLGMSLNGIFSRNFFPGNTILERNTDWAGSGELYFGSTYYLRRD